jgi:hypothetical protein
MPYLYRKGPDYSEVKAFDAQGQLLGSRRQDGY